MIQFNPQTIVELTQKLVQIPSEPGQEQEVARFLMDTLPAFGFGPVQVDENGSVIGVINGEQSGPTLLFDAHTDTVGVAPGVPWSQDPYSGARVGDKIFGRGTSDMKGAMAAMIVAAGAVEPAELAGRLVISASVMEEVLEGAALESIMTHYSPDFVIIGEASDLKIVHGGRGRAEIQLETIGIPAHTSSPESGINAVDAILPVLASIPSIHLPNDPFVGQAIIALTDIISDPYPGHSVIPSRCRATLDRRLIPGETREDVIGPLQRLPTIPDAKYNVSISYGEYRTYTDRVIKHEKWFPAWTLSPDHRLVRAAASSLNKIGLEPQFTAYNFCTNAAYSMGVAGVPTIGFGPSQEEMAHIPDEYIRIEPLIQAALLYKELIDTLLAARPE